MKNESSVSQPEIKSMRKSDDQVTIVIERRGREVTINGRVLDGKKALQQVFSDDLVGIILGETEMPEEQREAILARISEQYKQRVPKEMARKSLS